MFRSKNATKKNKRRRNESDDIASSHEADDEQIIAPVVSDRRKVNTFSTGSAKKPSRNLLETRQIESEREIVRHQYAGDATYESQIDTAKDRDARAILERNIALNKDESVDAQSGKVYRGQAGYKNYITKKESQVGMNKYTGTQGPIRAQTWARSICRFDYQPDICKDYKETGYCGYGDSCKFLHDRGDYKSGWQIEREEEERERKKQKQLAQGKGGDGGEEEDEDDKYVIHSDDDEEQFACTICRQPFHNAVETTCGHLFCEQCALKHFKKTSRCFNCRKQTGGVFNVADKLRQREREQRQAEEQEEEDEKADEGRSDDANGNDWGQRSHEDKEDKEDKEEASKEETEASSSETVGGWVQVEQ